MCGFVFSFVMCVKYNLFHNIHISDGKGTYLNSYTLSNTLSTENGFSFPCSRATTSMKQMNMTDRRCSKGKKIYSKGTKTCSKGTKICSKGIKFRPSNTGQISNPLALSILQKQQMFKGPRNQPFEHPGTNHIDINHTNINHIDVNHIDVNHIDVNRMDNNHTSY